MGKRPRTPHFITGIGDGDVNHRSANNQTPDDPLFKKERRSGKNLRRNRFIRTRNERQVRLDEPLAATDQWRDVFGSGDPDIAKAAAITSGMLSVSPFALLGLIVMVSAIFLHMISESSSESTSRYRRRQRQRRMYRTRKKKTDEWSDDEEELLKENYAAHENEHGVPEQQQFYPHYYEQPSAVGAMSSSQEHRKRRTSYKEPDVSPKPSGGYTGGSTYYMPQQAAVPSYRSPAANMMHSTPAGVHRRVSPMNSNAANSQGPSPVRHAALHPYDTPNSFSSGGEGVSPAYVASPAYLGSPSGGRMRVVDPLNATDSFAAASLSAHHQQSAQLTPDLPRPAGTGSNVVRPLSSNFSSFESLTGATAHKHNSDSSHSLEIRDILQTRSLDSDFNSFHGSIGARDDYPMTPGKYEETPLAANFGRKTVEMDEHGTPGLNAALLPPLGSESGRQPRIIPFIPSLEAAKQLANLDRLPKPRPGTLALPPPPPRSMPLDDLRLVQMETGSSDHWKQASVNLQKHLAASQEFYKEGSTEHFLYESDGASDVSIPSGDPRKSIIHKRKNLTMATDASTSLQSDINFDEIKLVEVIGGGGFGQVWRASWRGTPVAVKVLTGGAQNTHVAKAILEEFKAEINLLKGMRHPNVCLYMGACVDPPNRAIVIELAANGSVWDALRLPLMPPYVPSDGTSGSAWPLRLYMPDEHGTPPRRSGYGSPRISAPMLPKGTWPWGLVKRVACGAARGMAYLHSGNPPVLHRDLKSANILLDDSYTAKVCDFGLSRLKAQERSMTGNCGTVQWMAPEVLANMSYNEKADVYSYGIIVWELLSRECPYDGMSAIQCALAVLNRDKRPEIPKWCPPSLHALIKSCTKKDPNHRPSFVQILRALDAMEG